MMVLDIHGVLAVLLLEIAIPDQGDKSTLQSLAMRSGGVRQNVSVVFHLGRLPLPGL